MLDPVVEAFYVQGQAPVAHSINPTTSIDYDSFGLSAYGRLALFTFELLKKEDINISLFLSYPDTMTWVMGELLKVRQGCLDAFQTPSCDNGVFYSPNLHTDANGVVFRTLLRELSSMVASWITLALEENWESRVIEALTNRHTGPTVSQDDDDDDDGGCNPTFFVQEALREQDGFNERILADLVSALAQSESSDISSANAKGWCQLLKSETRKSCEMHSHDALLIVVTNTHHHSSDIFFRVSASVLVHGTHCCAQESTGEHQRICQLTLPVGYNPHTA